MNAVVYPSYISVCVYIYVYHIMSLKCPYLLQPSLSAVIMEQLSNFCFCSLLIGLYNVCSEITLKYCRVRTDVQKRNLELGAKDIKI